MIEPKRLLTWSHLLLFLLHFAYAQPATEPAPSSPASASRHSWDLPNAVRIVAFICAFLIVGLCSACLDYWTGLYITSQNQTGGASVDWPWSCSQPRGIDRKILDTFPILVYSTIKDLKIGKGALECAVCLSEFKDYESLRMIPKCNHVFHPECIDVWLASHVTCPVCREKLNPDSGEVAIAVPTQLNAGVLEEGSAGRTRAELGESETEQHPQNEGQSRKDQNRRSKWRMFGKLPRSNSTGNSLVQSEKDLERHRLWLPEDVRKYILQNHGGIGRSASYNVVMPMVGKGTCGSDSEGSSRGKTSYIERQ